MKIAKLKIENLSFKSLFVILFFLLIAIVSLLKFFPKNKVSAGWFNDSWMYRKAVSISNTSGSNLTDFQVKALANVDLSSDVTAGKIRDDLGDLRFTDVNGQILPYWIEDTTTSSADAWVKISNIPTSGTTIYMYYGNPSASSLSNPQNIIGTSANPGISCTNIHDNRQPIDGIYYLDPDGGSLDNKFQAYCDMTTSGGGWTLAMKLDGTANTFEYVSPYWTNTATYNSNYPNFDTTEAKLQSYSTVSFTQINLAMKDALDINDDIDRITIDQTATSLYSLISSGSYTASSVGRSTWLSLLEGITVQANCNQEGFNPDGYYAHSRIGIAFNGEADCGSSDSVLGFGNSKDHPWGPYVTVGGGTAAANPVKAAYGWIFVRTNPQTISVSVSVPATEELSPAPIAYWKFDEGVGTTAYDSTSSRNNGIFGTGNSAPTWATEDQCISGKCLQFNGNNYLSYLNTSLPNVGNSANLTISAWIKPNTATGTIFSKGQDAACYNYGIVISGGTLKARNTNNDNVLGGTITTNTWQQLTIVYSNTGAQGYINGKYIGSNAAATTSNCASNQWVVGARAYNNLSSEKYNGYIDDIKIYPYSRTAAQIKSDYAAGKAHSSSTKGSSANLGSNKNNSEALSEGLVGYWKMDEGVGTTTADSSGNSNTGTISGASWSSAKYGVGTSFDGSNDYINMGDILDIGLSDMTVSTWIKTNTNHFSRIVSKNSGSTAGWFMGTESGGTFNAGIDGIFSTAFSATYNDNQWHNITTIWNRDGNLEMFFDGKSIGTYDISSKSSTNVQNGYNLTISSRNVESGFFNGLIDEVRIYNRALSPAEISQLYNWAPSPVGYWDFNEKTGTIANDKSGNNNHATLQNSANWGTGKYGGGFSLSTGASVNRAYTSSATNLNSSGGLSLEAWVNPSAYGSEEMTVIEGELPISYYLSVNSNGAINCYWYGTSPEGYHSSGAGTVPLNTWTHITCAWDGSNIRLYTNGILKNTVAVTGNGTDPGVIDIGAETTDRQFRGKIDEVKIYNYARTQKQIVEDMNAGHPAGGSPVGSQVGYWKFDEGFGTTVSNWGNGGIGLSGVFGTGNSAPTWTNNGKFGKALVFDGSKSYMYINDYTSSPLDVTQISLSAWIFPYTVAGGEHQIFSKSYSSAWELKQNNSALNVDAYHGGAYESGMMASGSVLQANTWQHVVWTYDGTTSIMYLNGKPVQTRSKSGDLGISNGTLYIGVRDGTFGFFNGIMDELKIYNYALTEDEIKIDYNRNSALQMGSLSSDAGNTAPATASSQEYCIPGDTANCSPPVAEYKFDEKNGTSAYDTSGNNNTGTLGTGNSAPTWTQGKIGSSLLFDGNNDYVNINNSSSLSSITNISLEAWVKPSSTGNYGIISKNWTEYTLSLSSNRLRFESTNINQFSTNAIPANQWSHVAVTYDSQIVKFYINGILDNTAVDVDGITSGSNNINIGKKTNESYYFPGSIDQVKVFNYARTPAQIAYDYNKGSPIGWWKFDECQGSTVYDWSGIGNTGSINIGSGGSQNSLGTCSVGTSAAWTAGASGKLNSSLNFDGTDDYIDCGNDDSLTFGSGKDFTYSTWIYSKTPSAGRWQGVVYHGDSSQSQGHLGINPTGYLEGGTGDGGTWQTHQTSYLILQNTWTHIVMSLNRSTNIMKFYANGIEVGSYSHSYIPAAPSINLRIGDGNTTASEHFDGQIDDVRIYNYALTSTQIKTLYNNGAVNFSGN